MYLSDKDTSDEVIICYYDFIIFGTKKNVETVFSPGMVFSEITYTLFRLMLKNSQNQKELKVFHTEIYVLLRLNKIITFAKHFKIFF